MSDVCYRLKKRNTVTEFTGGRCTPENRTGRNTAPILAGGEGGDHTRAPCEYSNAEQVRRAFVC